MTDAGDPPPRPDAVRVELAKLFTVGTVVDGASISVVGLTGVHSMISSTGGTAADLERMQFNLGEGPHWHTLGTGRSTLVGDIRTAASDRWPTFAREVRTLPVAAMFSIPMMLGAAVVGVVDLSRGRSGDLDVAELEQLTALARMVTPTAVRHATAAAHTDTSAALDGGAHPLPEMRREVHQATGMLIAQLQTSATNAFAVLRAYSFAHDRPIEEVARDIVGRRLDLAEPEA